MTKATDLKQNFNLTKVTDLKQNLVSIIGIKRIFFNGDLNMSISASSRICGLKLIRWRLRFILCVYECVLLYKKGRYLGKIHFCFYGKLDFLSQLGSCLAFSIFENGLETELTLPAKACLGDSFWSEHSFRAKISMRNQCFRK